MQPESQINLTRNLELRVVILFLIVVLFLLGSYTQKKADENETLKSSMKLLESSIEQQKQKKLQQFDSLQQLIQQQDKMHLLLKDSLSLIKTQRLHLKTRTDENKAAIHLIHDADSLRHAVARHYR